MENVTRYERIDSSEIVAMKDSNGFLYDEPRVARSGVYTYLDSKGNIRKEYRPVDVVFDPVSLATFEGKPITIEHPKAGKVTSETSHKLTVGTILSAGFPMETYLSDSDDRYVGCKIVIHNPEAIGDRRELSLGYTCDCEETEGTAPNGEHYNAIQRNIRCNHLAVVKKARAGKLARLNLDGDEYLYDDFDNAPTEGVVNNTQMGETKKKEDAQRMSLYRIDGLEVELQDSVIAHIKTLEARLDSANAEKEVAEKEKNVAQAKQEVAEDKLAQLQEDCETLKKKVADAIKEKEAIAAEKEEEKEEAVAEKDEELAEEKKEKAELEDKLDSAENNIIAMKTILEKAQSDMAIRKDSFDDLQERYDSMSAEYDELVAERDSLQAKLDAAIEEKEEAVENAKEEVKQEMAERNELEELAKQAKVDGAKDMSNKELKEAIIKSTRKNFDPEGKSEAYMDAAFDAAKEYMAKEQRQDSVKAQMDKIVGATKNDSEEKTMTALERRQAMINRQLSAYAEKEIKF